MRLCQTDFLVLGAFSRLRFSTRIIVLPANRDSFLPHFSFCINFILFILFMYLLSQCLIPWLGLPIEEVERGSEK